MDFIKFVAMYPSGIVQVDDIDDIGDGDYDVFDYSLPVEFGGNPLVVSLRKTLSPPTYAIIQNGHRAGNFEVSYFFIPTTPPQGVLVFSAVGCVPPYVWLTQEIDRWISANLNKNKS